MAAVEAPSEGINLFLFTLYLRPSGTFWNLRDFFTLYFNIDLKSLFNYTGTLQQIYRLLFVCFFVFFKPETKEHRAELAPLKSLSKDTGVITDSDVISSTWLERAASVSKERGTLAGECTE